MAKLITKTNSFGVLAALEKHKGLARRALADTLNATLRTVNVELAKEIQKDYTVKTTGVKRKTVVKKATRNNAVASTHYRSGAISLNRFAHRRTAKGMKVRVRTDSQGDVIPASFKASANKKSVSTYGSSPRTRKHREAKGKKRRIDHIWQRAERGATGGQRGAAVEAGDTEGISEFVGRFPIRPLFGPSIPMMIRTEKKDGVVRDVVKRVFKPRFRKRLNHLVKQQMGRKRKRRR